MYNKHLAKDFVTLIKNDSILVLMNLVSKKSFNINATKGFHLTKTEFTCPLTRP